jgi:hypothetical protein
VRQHQPSSGSGTAPSKLQGPRSASSPRSLVTSANFSLEFCPHMYRLFVLVLFIYIWYVKLNTCVLLVDPFFILRRSAGVLSLSLSLSWRRLGDLPAPAALRQVPRSSSGPSPKSSQQVCAPLLFPSRCAKLRTQTLADTVLAICVWIGSNFRCIHVVLCFLT